MTRYWPMGCDRMSYKPFAGVLPSDSAFPLCCLEADDHEALEDGGAMRLRDPKTSGGKTEASAHLGLLREQEIHPMMSSN